MVSIYSPWLNMSVYWSLHWDRTCTKVDSSIPNLNYNWELPIIYSQPEKETCINVSWETDQLFVVKKMFSFSCTSNFYLFTSLRTRPIYLLENYAHLLHHPNSIIFFSSHGLNQTKKWWFIEVFVKRQWQSFNISTYITKPWLYLTLQKTTEFSN